jgi:inosine-uridine nucleoside N-ribohydrolase
MDKSWKFLLYALLIFSILNGCSPLKETPPSQDPSSFIAYENQEAASPKPDSQTGEQIFSSTTQHPNIPVIYSHGGGPCDIGGMTYLSMHPDVDLIGIVLTRGEFHPEIAVNNWPIFIYDVLQSKDTALGLGSNERMDSNSHDFPEVWRPSSDNFWGLNLPAKATDYQPVVGYELIIDLVNNSPKKVTLIAMASMIDIALAIQHDPGIINNIEHVVIMGGAFTVPGNLSDAPYPIDNQVAEWNMWIDAEAAKYLFNSGVALSIVPLDAIQYLVQPDDVNTINSIIDPAVDYVAQIWNNQIGNNPGGFLIWDTITAVAVTNPEFFDWVYDGIDVITEPASLQGQTIPLNNGATHTRFATGADYQAIMEQLFETFQGETNSASPSEQIDQDLIITELAGTWEGFTGEYHITFFLGAECRLNEVCGTFEITEFSLSGDVTFVKVDGRRYEFKATNISSGQPGNEYEYLELLDNDSLRYFSQGPTVSSEAVLVRQ